MLHQIIWPSLTFSTNETGLNRSCCKFFLLKYSFWWVLICPNLSTHIELMRCPRRNLVRSTAMSALLRLEQFNILTIQMLLLFFRNDLDYWSTDLEINGCSSYSDWTLTLDRVYRKLSTSTKYFTLPRNEKEYQMFL